MTERAADFEWRGEGKEAEILLYAPDLAVAEASLERALSAARLPGAVSPVYVAASGTPSNFGWVAASETHAAPDLVSAPEWGLLIVVETPVESSRLEEVPRLISRGLSEVALPSVEEAEVRKLAGSGALWAAEEGLIEEEDLHSLDALAGDADALSRRALSAGTRDWTRPGDIRALQVAEILDSDGAGELGLEAGSLAIAVGVHAEDLGRLSMASHRDRISARLSSGSFGDPGDLPAAPAETEEARDLVFAANATTNYAAGRAALVLYALRRALREAGTLDLRAAWKIGGFEERNGRILHRNRLAAVVARDAFVAGQTVAAGTGGMLGSAPPFEASAEVSEEGGRWPWEESGILARWAVLELL